MKISKGNIIIPNEKVNKVYSAFPIPFWFIEKVEFINDLLIYEIIK
jgi:hypothetical protein